MNGSLLSLRSSLPSWPWRNCCNDPANGSSQFLRFCLMPDHAHLVARGVSEDANLRSLILSWNTWTAHAWRRARGGRLWQSGYYDHILRDGSAYLRVARYVLLNPVRAGLVDRAEDYPFSGSTEYPIAEILAGAHLPRQP